MPSPFLSSAPAVPLSQGGAPPAPSVELQNLLLGLGAFLLMVAALVFATVTWTRLSAAVQGSILFGLTALAVAATTALRRRDLRSTAEAVGVVTVVLGLVDGRAVQVAGFPHVRGQLYWAVAVGALAMAAWAFGRLAAVRSARLAAVTLAQLSAPLAATGLHAFSIDLFAAVLVMQAAVASYMWRAGTLADCEWPVRIGAPAAWAAGTGVALGRLLDVGAHPAFTDVVAPAALTLAAALVAGLAAAWWSDRDDVRAPALATLTALAVAAAVGLAQVWWTGQALGVAAGTAAVVALVLTTRLPARWGDAPAAVAGAVLGVAAVAVVASAGTLSPVAPGGPWPLPTNFSAVVLLAQAGVVLVLVRPDRPGPAAWPARAGALVAWSTAVAVGLAGLLTQVPTWPALRVSAGVAALGAVLAAAAAWCWRRRDDARIVASAAAATVGLSAVVGALHAWWAGDQLALAAGALAVTVLAVATRVPRRWGDAPALVGVAALGVATSFGAGRLAVALLAPILRRGQVWTGHAGTGVRSLVESAIGRGPVAAYVLVLASGLLAAAPRMGRSARAGVTAVIIALAASVAPLLAGASVATTVSWLLAVATAAAASATALALGRNQRVTGRAGSDATATVAWWVSGWATVSALGWGLLVPGTTIAVLTAVAFGASAVAALATRHQRRALALAAASVATLGAATLVPVVLRASGTTVGSAWLGLAVGACLLSLTAWVVATAAGRSGAHWPGAGRPGGLHAEVRRDGSDGDPVMSGVAVAIELSCAVAAGLGAAGVVVAGSPGRASVMLLATSLALTAHATRPGRRFLTSLAATGGLTLLWQRLALGGVTTAEAYTLPLAAVLLTAGALLNRRHQDRSTWTTFGPGLVAATGPTVLLALGDAGLVRPLGALAAGAALVVVGASRRWQAPVGVGAAVVVAIGLEQVGPVVGHLPRWISFGLAGIVLLSVGATYERRRRELVELRRRVASLR